MVGVATYSKSGTKATTTATLNKAVFGCDVGNHELLKLAYLSYLGEKRPNLAKTKKRGEVRGSTIKPWKQKGTGRARFGSRYNPLWRGGGIVFGPSGEENYKKTINKQVKKKALRQALSLSVKDKKVSIVETFECKDGKVAPTKKLFNKMNLSGNILLVVSAKDELVERATRNLSTTKAVQADYLTVYDILNADNIVISKKSLDVINSWLGGTK
jgi:large subunit ribosomal protein L4